MSANRLKAQDFSGRCKVDSLNYDPLNVSGAGYWGVDELVGFAFARDCAPTRLGFS